VKFPRVGYLLAANLAHACEAVARDGARPLAGGQSLLPLMAFRLSRPDVLVDVSRLEELRGIEVESAHNGGELVVGAAVTHAEIEQSPLIASVLPALAEVASNIGHPAIRRLGTIGGSIAHADPAAEWPATCIALDADVEVCSTGGVRRVSVESIVAGPYQTTLSNGELLCRLHFPIAAARRVALAEITRDTGDFALAGAVCVLDDGNPPAAAVTFFGVEGRPRRVRIPASAFTGPAREGGPPDQLARELAVNLGTVLEDGNADAVFRCHLAVVAAARALRRAEGGARTVGEV
jgi:aerobic carbon-monoxide dehydrogenase medium subunit